MRTIIATLVLAAVGMVAGSCSKPVPPLKVGTNNWPGYQPGYLAQELNFFRPGSVEMAMLPSAAEVMRAFRNRAIDVAAVTLDEAMQIAEHINDLRIILICNYSNGADTILARPEFESVAALRGRRVGVEHTAVGAFMFTRALEKAGMAADEVEIVPVPLDEHEDAFRQGRVDAIVTFEPVRSRLLATGAREVFTSAEIPGEIIDVLITTADTLNRRHQDIATLADGWMKGRYYMMEVNPLDAARRAAPRLDISPPAVIEALGGLVLPGRDENLRLLAASGDNILKYIARLNNLMLEQKLIEKEVNDLLPDDRFIRMATP